MTEWFEQWFGEEYLRLYPHRDDKDAECLAELIQQYHPLDGRRVLDLACGPGRHATQFAARGARVVGFDLSMPLLSRAKHRGGPPLTLVRGDMRRLPFRPGTFDLVVNLFTSFGYFADDAQHRAVLHGAARVLRDSGTFVLDYLNAPTVVRTLVTHEVRKAGEQQIAVERRISADQRFVIKEIHLVDDGRSFVERVRLFSPSELEDMLAAAGLTVHERLGDYHGRQASDETPRVIFLAKRR
ncbi:MAG: methyltransferase domain-containing protein [Gemmatimonadales bacterium]|nr:methyltransferase domain-containing protein [Gemmatimonadales bacterium]